MCLLCGVIGANESDKVAHGPIASTTNFGKQLEAEGLPAQGREPKLQQYKLLGYGDMAYQWKLCGSGGACKVMKHFDHMSEVHGYVDIFRYIEGDSRCDLCVANNLDKYYHRAVNDPVEITNKPSL